MIKDDSFSLSALTQVISFLISVQLIVQIHPSPYPLSNPTCGDHFSKQNGQKNVTKVDAFSRSVDYSLLKS